MKMLRALLTLPIVVAFMAVVDVVLFRLPIPGWIPVVLIVFQALYVTVTYGFLLMGAMMPRREDVAPERATRRR